MYSDVILAFSGSNLEVYARVDLRKRFTKMFGRSISRGYQWLESGKCRDENELNTYAPMECILSKLKEFKDPSEVINRVAKKTWSLRGVDLDSEFPIPSLAQPPVRQKTGRKYKPKISFPVMLDCCA